MTSLTQYQHRLTLIPIMNALISILALLAVVRPVYAQAGDRAIEVFNTLITSPAYIVLMIVMLAVAAGNGYRESCRA